MSFRLYKAHGPPGRWYGYVTLDGVEYKISAQSVGAKREKHIVGTVKRNLKADQREMFTPPSGPPPDPGRVPGSQGSLAPDVPHFDFDDEVGGIPF